jgi:hypothetical protein
MRSYASCVLALLISLLLHATQALAERERWYNYWGLGFSAHSYPSAITAPFSRANDQPGVSRLSFLADLYGFYVPVDEHWIVGGNIMLNGDFVYFGWEKKEAAIGQLLVGPSALRFFDSSEDAEPGVGPFIRLGLGLSKASSEFREEGTRRILIESSPWGIGAVAGAGYGWSIAPGARLLVSGLISARIIAGQTYVQGAAILGFLL